MSIRVLAVDDHEVVRTGLKSMLAGTDIKIVAEASNGDEALKLVATCDPQLVLLDVRMGEGDGLNTLARLKAEHPNLPVLVFSTYDNPTFIARAVALRAAGYILKGTSRERLLDAMQQAAAGETVFTREELRRVTGALATPRIAGNVDVPLTHRESEVLEQLAGGLTNKEIAAALSISYETVKEHVQHILHKIGVVDRTQAAVWAVHKGLV